MFGDWNGMSFGQWWGALGVTPTVDGRIRLTGLWRGVFNKWDGQMRVKWQANLER